MQQLPHYPSNSGVHVTYTSSLILTKYGMMKEIQPSAQYYLYHSGKLWIIGYIVQGIFIQ